MGSETSLNGRVPGWRDFLGESPKRAQIPEALSKGSLRGVLFEDGKDPSPIPDFGMVFRGSRTSGKGIHGDEEYVLTGKCCMVVDQASAGEGVGRVRLAVTRLHTQQDEPAVLQRAEMRLEVMLNVKDASGKDQGVGLEGAYYALKGDSLFTKRVVFWPTPPEERKGGFMEVQFQEGICGVEHTGTLAEWVGIGAEVKRVQGPAEQHGLRQGDLIVSVNNEHLPRGSKSLEISKLIKHSQRPMTMRFWRDVSVTNIKPVPDLEAEEEEKESRDTFRFSFDEMESRTKALREHMMREVKKKRTSLNEIKREKQQKNTDNENENNDNQEDFESGRRDSIRNS